MVHQHPTSLTADVVVVGGRCAGATTAMLLARAGHEVVVLDKARFPSDTNSTHSIARPGVVQLTRWGIVDRVVASGAPPCRLVDLYAAGTRVRRTVKKRHGTAFLINPRRAVLDTILREAAAEAGARLLSDCVAVGLTRDDTGRVSGVVARSRSRDVEIRARHTVGADGLGSRVARWVEAPFLDLRPTTGATQYAYVPGDWPALEYHTGEAGFAGVFPTHGGEACIWICTPTDRARRHRRAHPQDGGLLSLLQAVVPQLADRVVAAGRRTPTRGMLRMPNHRRAAHGPGWALVGDAGMHRDAITGFGISDAFRDAELLSDALVAALASPADSAAALENYQLERDRLSGPVFELTQRLAAFPDQQAFAELLRQLAEAIDDHAAELADRVGPAARTTACA